MSTEPSAEMRGRELSADTLGLGPSAAGRRRACSSAVTAGDAGGPERVRRTRACLSPGVTFRGVADAGGHLSLRTECSDEGPCLLWALLDLHTAAHDAYTRHEHRRRGTNWGAG